MSTYPRFFTLIDSTATPGSGVEPQRATNGSLKVRRLWASDKTSFDVRHVLTSAEKATLDSFYSAEKDNNVDYIWPGDGLTYSVRFAAPPAYTKRTNRFEVRVTLLQV